MTKIYTLRDAQRAKLAAEARSTRKVNVRGFVVLDATGSVLGRCATRMSANRFIDDSLNTQGWTVALARSL